MPGRLRVHRYMACSLLPASWDQAVINRLGFLNVFSPHYPDGFYNLDLARADERRIAEMLVKLAVRCQAMSLLVKRNRQYDLVWYGRWLNPERTGWMKPTLTGRSSCQ